MNTDSKTWLSDLSLLTLLIVILFGAFLGTRPLAVPDEARYSEIPREMVVSDDYVTPHINSIKYFEKPPLFYWMQASAIKLFGLSEWAMRLVNACMALFGCLMTYCAARQLYDRKTGWLASTMLATSVLYFAMAHFVTLDMTVSVLLTGCLFSFILGTKKKPGKERNVYMWSMYVFSALATLTKGLIGIIFPGAIIFIWMLLLNDWRNLKTYCLPTGVLLWLILVLPWHIIVQIRNPEFFHFYIIDQHFARYFTTYANREQAWWFLPIFFIFGLFPWIAFLPQAIFSHKPALWKQRYQHPEALFFLIWIIFIYLFFSFSHSQLPPYLLPIFPPLMIFIGHYLASHWQIRTKVITTGITITAIVSLVAIIALLLILSLPYGPPKTVFIAVSAVLGLLTAIAPVLVYWKIGTKPAVIILLITFGFFLISLTPSYLPFEQKSIKSLAMQIKPKLQTTDEVVSYHGYFQDLPFYLQRRVILVGWGNSELDFGMQHQDMTGWMLTEGDFWKKWQESTQMFMFLSKNDYNNLLKNKAYKLCLIAQTSRNVLVSNKC